MVELYAEKASKIEADALDSALDASLSRLKPKERKFYEELVANGITEFTPIEMVRQLGVSNKTIINWSSALASCGLLEPQFVKQRIRSWSG